MFNKDTVTLQFIITAEKGQLQHLQCCCLYAIMISVIKSIVPYFFNGLDELVFLQVLEVCIFCESKNDRQMTILFGQFNKEQS